MIKDLARRLFSFDGGLRDLLRDEYYAQREQVVLLFPVFLAFGIAAYFMLPSEPPIALGVFLGVFGLAAFLALRTRFFFSGVIICLLCLGFSVAQFRAHNVYTPILQKDIGPVMLEGRLVAIEDLGVKGARLLLADPVIEDLEPFRTPRKVRVKVWKDDGLRVGQRISVLAKLMPPSLPVIPGGFDFQRFLFFKGIGGVGFSLSDAKILQEPERGFVTSFLRSVQSMRQYIVKRIERYTAHPEASILMALMVGEKSAISSGDQDAMRHAGLAHMLAISGLHVGLFTGVFFFLLRFLLVSIPGVALHYPVKKITAVCAIFAAIFYMLIAGMTIPTVRAVLMTGIVLFAVVLDRSALSLRLVGFAAFVVLLLFPESLFSASFHLSFAAVVGLVVFYNWLRPYWSAWRSEGRVLRVVGLYFIGICLTTIVATLATAPFTLFHFNQMATYGLVGNVLAMPVLAFFVMPFILLALLLMPFGLDRFLFFIAGQGGGLLLKVAHFVSEIEGAVFRVAAFNPWSVVCFVLGALCVVILRGRLKLLCLPFFLLFFSFISFVNQYDTFVFSKSGLISFAHEDKLYVSDFRKGRFAREVLAKSLAMDEGAFMRWPKEGGHDVLHCDEYACRFQLRGVEFSYLYHPSVINDECAFASVVIAPFPIGRCDASHVIDLFDMRRKGAHAIRITQDIVPAAGAHPVHISVDNAVDIRGDRLWSGANLGF